MTDLPASPFGPACPPYALDGVCFGAFVKSGDSDTPHGFFIEPGPLRARLLAYALAVPGAPVGEALLAVGLPPPIKALASEWTPDWRQRWRSSRPYPFGPRNPAGEAEARPSESWRPPRNHGGPSDSPRFLWIQAPAPRHFGSPREGSDSSASLAQLWREELASQGVPTHPWTGRSLLLLDRGHSGDDILEEALAQCEAAILSLASRAPAGAGRAAPPRRAL